MVPIFFVDVISLVGALCFGIVIGWITYRTLRRSTVSGLGDIATILGAIGGAAVTALFRRDTGEFGAYCIGLLIGFFWYLKKGSEPNAPPWLKFQAGSERDAPAGGFTDVKPPPPPRKD